MMVKIVHDELAALMGPVDARIYYVSPPPTIIMMAGLQGSGKTTTCAKLAKRILAQGRRPMLVACDLQRPAAVEQLTIVGEQAGVPVFRMEGEKNPVRVARQAVTWAQQNDRDVVIVDTAGRLHIDEEMMKQAQDIAKAVSPHQIYLVCDSMTGQDAVTSAREFNARLELDGVILTKFDSDARGGAALSIKAVTGKPVKFIGVGEKLDDIEEFHADRMAGRILGMGDVVSLVEKAQQQFDAEQASKMQEKMARGRFTLDDFLAQMRQMKKMGPLKEILKMLGMGGSDMAGMVQGDELKGMEAIILSMTPAERETPDVIEASRRRRIARGSGTDPQDVSGLIKQFTMAAGMMKQMSNMGTRDRMKFAQQVGQAGMMGMTPKFKIKQRSKRLTKKDREKKKKTRR
jgi:signal recognition particle subunit SRP54